MSLLKYFILLSFALSAAALATPHVLRHNLHHRSVAARIPLPAPVPLNSSQGQVIRKRSLNKRCKPRTPPSSSSPTATATKVVNAGSEPTSSAVDPPPPTTTHTQHQTTPPPAPTQPSGDEPSYMIGTQTGDGPSPASPSLVASLANFSSHDSGTFYATGLGACGITNNDSQHIVAVSHLLFDTFPYVPLSSFFFLVLFDSPPSVDMKAGTPTTILSAAAELPPLVRSRSFSSSNRRSRISRPRQECRPHHHRSLCGVQGHRPGHGSKRFRPDRGSFSRSHSRYDLDLGLVSSLRHPFQPLLIYGSRNTLVPSLFFICHYIPRASRHSPGAKVHSLNPLCQQSG